MDNKKRTIRRMMASAVTAGILAASAISPAVALAENNTPSAGAASGGGQTELTMILQNTQEVSQSDENLQFTVPSSINYVVKADGSLVGPTAGAAKISNESGFGIHVTNLAVTAESPFNIVADVTASEALSTANAVDMTIGPAADQLNAASYLSKTAPTTPTAWNMSAKDASADTDDVALTTAGHVARISQDITTATKFGQIQWYVQAGQAS